jgi:heat shock protein HspQ
MTDAFDPDPTAADATGFKALVDETFVDAMAKFKIGDVVRHRLFPFRGVIFDVDPQFANTDEWWESIPEEIRPDKAQPFYHLFAENDQNSYVAYVSQQNLLPDESEEPVSHPAIPEMFSDYKGGSYIPRRERMN